MMRGSRNRPMELPPDELDGPLPDDWPFPAEKLYRWLVLGRRVDRMLQSTKPPDHADGDWRFGWNACLDSIRDGFVTTDPGASPTPDAALHLLRDLVAELADQRGLNVKTLGANLRLVAQLLADEIERNQQ